MQGKRLPLPSHRHHLHHSVCFLHPTHLPLPHHAPYAQTLRQTTQEKAHENNNNSSSNNKNTRLNNVSHVFFFV